MRIIALAAVSIMSALNFVLVPLLPAQIPMHWNINGVVDRYMAKEYAVWILPGICLILLILFKVLPYFDPKKDKYHLFKREWEILQTGFVLFFTYLQFVTLYIAMNPGVPMVPLMFMGMGSLFILIGNYLSKIRQNYFIGIKLPWTLASEDNWNKTHRFASWCFVLIGIIMLAEAYFQWNSGPVVFAAIGLGVLAPSLYSYLLFKKK